MKTTLTITIAVLMASTLRAAEIPVAAPESVGMSSEALQRLTAATQEFVDEGQFPGVLTMVAREGRIVHVSAVGQRGVEDDRPLPEDALFRIFSMTKPITAVAAMMLYEDGAFQLDDPVATFLPELKELEVLGEDGQRVPAEKTMTMRHLLTHTAGFSYGFDPEEDPVDRLYNEVAPFRADDLDGFIGRLAKLPLKFEPGTQWHYSVASDVVGAAVERISGQSFDVFLRERLFGPLDMRDTFFTVPEDKISRLLPNHVWNPDARKVFVYDRGNWGKRPATLFSGGGGLVSTARDYMRFAEMLRNGGTLNGVRILLPETVDLMVTNQLPAALSGAAQGERPTAIHKDAPGFGFGLGFGLVTALGDGDAGSVGAYSWGGAAGTEFWIDPVEEVVVIGMVQLMGSPWPFEEKLKALTYEALTDRK